MRRLIPAALTLTLAVAASSCATPNPSLNSDPSPTAPATVTTPGPSAAPYPTGQPGHPQLGGASWKIVELGGRAETGFAYLEFWGGQGMGEAMGLAEGNCWAIGLTYSYDPTGSGLIFDVSPEGDGRYAEGCSPQELATYADVADVLQDVTAWRRPQSDRLELLDGAGSVVLRGEPPPPLPSPPPGGVCGSVPIDACREAATLAFAGLTLASGETIVGWSVRPTIYTSCASGSRPVYDVVIEFANPDWEKVAVIGELFGRLAGCGDY